MVAEGFISAVIHPEALPLLVIVMVLFLASPVLVALYSEMVVAVCRQWRKTVTRLEDALGKCDACRHTAPVHLTYRSRTPLGDIFLDLGHLGC